MALVPSAMPGLVLLSTFASSLQRKSTLFYGTYAHMYVSGSSVGRVPCSFPF